MPEEPIIPQEPERDDRPPRATPEELEPPMDTHGNRSRRRNSSSSLTSSPLIMMAVVSLVVSIVVTMMILPWLGGGSMVTKKDFTTNIGNLATTIDKVKSDANAALVPLKSSVDGIPSQVSTAVNNATANFLKQSDINELNGTVSGLSNQVATLNGNYGNLSATVTELSSDTTTNAASISAQTEQINGLNVTITDLTTQLDDALARIEVLETTPTPTPTPTPTTVAESLSVTVKTMSGALYPTDNVTLTTAFRVQVKNNTTSTIGDIVLGIQVQTIGIQGTPTYTLSGGNTNWQPLGYNYAGAYFINNAWGLNIKAGETLTLYLTLTARNTAFNYQALYPNGVPFNIDVQVQ